MGDENKRVAKAFVDKYFPLKQQSTSLSDVLDKVGLPSNSSPPLPESSNSKKQGSADGHTQSSTSTSTSKKGLQKGSSNNPAILWEVPESCLVGSAVGYGSRDYYSPNPQSNRHVGNYSYEEKDRKGGRDHKASENPKGEWWQGSHNY